VAKQNKHDWNSWEKYLAIHDRVLTQYIRSYSGTGPERYSVRKITDQHYELSLKNLILQNSENKSIEFKIEKTVEIDITFARPRARIFAYSYHALTPKPNARNLIRYCSPHDHRPTHHKHIYQLDGSYNVIEVSRTGFPHVSEFFDEVLSLSI
jgi:hypothetical protein